MFQRFISSATYTVACALAFYPAVARADALPTVTITSASGSANWGDYSEGCQGICIGLDSPLFSLGFGGVAPAPYFQARPGYSYLPSLDSAEALGVTNYALGGVVLDGVSYQVVYAGVQVTGAPFVVPYGGTVEVPAVLTDTGTACTAIYYIFGCYPAPWTTPYPVVVANVDVDIQGYLTLTFEQSPELAPDILFSATFTPVPEPPTALLLFVASALIAIWRGRNFIPGFSRT